MELTQAFEDKAVRELLLGEEAGQAEAFAQLDAHLRKRFVQGARGRLPGMPPEDLADAWQETLKDLLHAVRTRTLDPVRELCPWLWKVFIRRVFDGLRSRKRYEGLLQRVRGRLAGTAGDVLGRMDEEDRAQLLQSIRRAVGGLPPRQRTVIEVFVDHYPETQDLEALRDRVSKVTGRQETHAAVSRALQEARRKVGDVLKNQQH